MNVRVLQTYFYLIEGAEDSTSADARSEEQILEFVEGLNELVGALQTYEYDTEEVIQSLFYDQAKATFGESKADIRDFFKMLYMFLFQRTSGPRWGQFVHIFGVDQFVDLCMRKIEASDDLIDLRRA